MKLRHNTLITNGQGAALEFVSKLEKIEMIDQKTFYRMIDMNVSRETRSGLEFICPKFPASKDYTPIIKLKAFHLGMEFICDAERFEYDSPKEENLLNGLKYTTQKMLYSYMYDIYESDSIEFISTLGYSSCIKTFLETASAGSKIDPESVSDNIKILDIPEANKLWAKYSTFSHNTSKDPFIVGDIGVNSKIWDDLILLTDKVIPKIFDEMETYFEDHLMLKYVRVFRAWMMLIPNKLQRPNIKNFRIIEEVNKTVKLQLKNMQGLRFKDYNKATGYNNASFIRAFNYIEPITKEEKIDLAKYSHREMYEKLNIIKYRKDGTTFRVLGDQKSFNLINKRVNTITKEILKDMVLITLEEI